MAKVWMPQRFRSYVPNSHDLYKGSRGWESLEDPSKANGKWAGKGGKESKRLVLPLPDNIKRILPRQNSKKRGRNAGRRVDHYSPSPERPAKVQRNNSPGPRRPEERERGRKTRRWSPPPPYQRAPPPAPLHRAPPSSTPRKRGPPRFPPRAPRHREPAPASRPSQREPEREFNSALLECPIKYCGSPEPMDCRPDEFEGLAITVSGLNLFGPPVETVQAVGHGHY
ncbi:MAG: hypothetical protein M1814_000603 [Vezdaea aestivalis]|nr:MAG: hypothetical protein M1814_000603 [Vezdaea aestivalis]